jgi:hypothetical protein
MPSYADDYRTGSAAPDPLPLPLLFPPVTGFSIPYSAKTNTAEELQAEDCINILREKEGMAICHCHRMTPKKPVLGRV